MSSSAPAAPRPPHNLADLVRRAAQRDGSHPAFIAGDQRLSLAELLAWKDTLPEVSRGGEDLAALVYTSGTSGTPRGAMLSHRALLANLEQCATITPPVVSPADVVLLVLPLFHIYGLQPGLGMV